MKPLVPLVEMSVVENHKLSMAQFMLYKKRSTDQKVTGSTPVGCTIQQQGLT